MNTNPQELRKQFDQFLEYMRKHGRSQESVRSYARTYILFLEDGHTYVDTVTVEKFLSRYTNPATWNKGLNHLRSFSRFITRAHTTGVRDTVGTLMLEQRKVPLRLPETVEDSNVDAVLADLKEASPETWAFVTLQRNTGMRFSEILNLREENYEESGLTPLVKFVGKGNAERIVTLNKDAFIAWQLWSKLDHYPAANTIRWNIAQAEQRTGTKHFKPHWLRHTVATKLDRQNVSHERIADLLGNTVEVVRARYRRMNSDKLAEVTDLL